MKSLKKVIIIAFVATFSLCSLANAQTKYFTREAKVKFNSKAALEEITGLNKKATSVIDTETGQIEFSILMKAFEFEKALMMEHFNENYVESTKYPKAVFKGTIDNKADVNWKKDGTYPVKVSGSMTLHGETKGVNASGTIMIKGGVIAAHSEFSLTLADFKIEIPKVVKEKIAEIVNITVDANYEPLQ
jgi:polyisoprenoid-binding protein YceI